MKKVTNKKNNQVFIVKKKKQPNKKGKGNMYA